MGFGEIYKSLQLVFIYICPTISSSVVPTNLNLISKYHNKNQTTNIKMLIYTTYTVP